ncbi:D-alanine--D-alanine ligase family protein [Nocardioides alcanivorans]|uniref:D-alanine--D-alanine ligase family protein n=1 Tax=Nocardioides alcanivorans TaxID=2897352 RepID=UPI001F43DD65|nr:D-alanine--D-alanine ligase [Nocardioides alcanivorans]
MIRVALVGGGANCEHEVSLASAHSVAKALTTAHIGGARIEVLPLTIAPDGTWWAEGMPLAASRHASLAAAVTLIGGCDVLMPMVHGPHGEDGTLPALADLAGVPCVGSALGAGALAMDKWTTKLVAEAVGVATAAGRLVRPDDVVPWTGPVVVKPVAAGSSHGVTLVRTAAELGPALAHAFALDDRVLVEELLVGREIDIAVLAGREGPRLSPPLEISVRAGTLFDTGQKYDGSAGFLIPAPLDEVDLKGLREAATAVFEALGCAGVARVDFFLTERGWVLNEVNTVPGMTEHSQVPRMFAAAGHPYPDLLAELVAAALTQ